MTLITCNSTCSAPVKAKIHSFSSFLSREYNKPIHKLTMNRTRRKNDFCRTTCSGTFPEQLRDRFETLKLPAQLWYKIHVFYMDRTSKTTGRRKKWCCMTPTVRFGGRCDRLGLQYRRGRLFFGDVGVRKRHTKRKREIIDEERETQHQQPWHQRIARFGMKTSSLLSGHVKKWRGNKGNNVNFFGEMVLR